MWVDGHDGQVPLVTVVQALASVLDLRSGPLAVAELPRGRVPATALGVPAMLSVHAQALDVPLAIEAMAVLAERATGVYVPDLAPRRQPPALIDATLCAPATSLCRWGHSTAAKPTRWPPSIW